MGKKELPRAATVNPKEDRPMADSMSLVDDIVIVRLDHRHDRNSFHHDSCLSHRVRRDCWWCCSGFGRHEYEES
ncbi:hypothetical protein A2U01_0074266 [Trifolium medium]|uniref:Uncharacterized protein n=1 Tax=Trifolium medium TaxID=97028 RepID=A0A392SYT8_9FABA|nr:hypothetical protein [Trifolium medium]